MQCFSPGLVSSKFFMTIQTLESVCAKEELCVVVATLCVCCIVLYMKVAFCASPYVLFHVHNKTVEECDDCMLKKL